MAKGQCLIPFKRKGMTKTELQAEVKRLKNACIKANYEVCQILGAVLNYPRFCDDQKNFPGSTPEDGVFVGEHVAETIAAEAADKITNLKKVIKEMEYE